MQDDKSMRPEQPTQQRRSSWSIPIGTITILSAVALLAGGGTAWWAWHSISSKPLSTPPASSRAPTPAQPTQSPVNQAPTEQTIQVYWLKTVENRIEPTATPVTVAAEQPEAVLKAAFDEMLAGASDPELASAIPQGTKLEQVEVMSDGVHVDLSKEFTTGGGSASMVGRLAQVIYTATTLDPDTQVWISVEGEPLEVLGGEGILVDQPMTRESFEQNFEL